jgi:hypothetical protein
MFHQASNMADLSSFTIFLENESKIGGFSIPIETEL